MRRRWHLILRTLGPVRLVLLAGVGAALLCGIEMFRSGGTAAFSAWAEEQGIRFARKTMTEWFPAAGTKSKEQFVKQPVLFQYLSSMEQSGNLSGTYASGGTGQETQYAAGSLREEPIPGEEGMKAGEGTGEGEHQGTEQETGENGNQGMAQETEQENGVDAEAAGPAGSSFLLGKLADYDYLMQNFYSVHPTTTAGRELMKAEDFLSMDLSLEKDPEHPQILIYHTHSQEEFSDYPENPEATIVGVGTYLAELLEEKGYAVIHDTSVYDLKDGKLDRSQAYTYALDGINGILQEYPSIEVVLDVHRDGVAEGTRLVTAINGKPTARIMFFNGLSQTPDGPIEYLPNSNREGNLAFSFQMQLKAQEQFPDFTRKIYLKGLRYNLHVRPRSSLIEVGAQTNTYEEARNAMEPLAELIDQVLSGE